MQARSLWLGCLLRGAHQLDDHRSDAATIAAALAPMCLAQFRDYMAVMAAPVAATLHVPRLPPDFAAPGSSADELDRAVALRAVLETRAADRRR